MNELTLAVIGRQTARSQGQKIAESLYDNEIQLLIE